MEPDRFDDVAFRMIEEPEPPRRRPRRRRAAVATGASVALVGVLAAGAPALGVSVQDQAAKATNTAVKQHGVQSYDGVRPCRKGEGHRRDRDSDGAGLSY